MHSSPVCLIFVFAALLVAATSGCISPAAQFPKLEARGELRLDASIRHIDVTVLEPGVPFQLREPITKADATVTTAREAARETLIAGGEAAILFPASYLIGGLAGATFGVSEGNARRSTQAIERAVAAIALPARASDAFLAAVAPQVSVNATRVADDLPLTAPAKARLPASRRRGAPAPPVSGAAAEPGDPTLSRADALVGVRVFFHGFQLVPPEIAPFKLRNAFNPPLQIVIVVSFAAVRGRDGAELGGISAHYTSRPQTFTAWAADDAAAFRRELAQAQAEIAAAVIARVKIFPAGE